MKLILIIQNLARIFILALPLLLLATSEGLAYEPGHPTITVLTLDDRPPNNLFLKQLGAIAGIDLVVEFGPSPSTDADCVSLNAAACGSLVGSRTADPWTLTPPEVRPDALLHFAVPRVQPTVTDPAVLAEYSRIMQDLAKPEIQRIVVRALTDESFQLDDNYLKEYKDRITGWLNFLERGNFDPDRLLITLDDNRPGPLSDTVKLLFGKYSNYVYDGTDEGMMLLLARALGERRDSLPSTCPVVFTDPLDMVSVQPLESGIMIENILTMVDWLQMRINPRWDLYDEWRPVLWIHGGDDEVERARRIVEIGETLGNKPVIVADAAVVNGGDTTLIETWELGHVPSGLTGYVGWNTASNTLGSAIALWAVVDYAYESTSDPAGVRAGVETFLWSRIIDDYLYQSIARSEAIQLANQEGINTWKMSDEETVRLAVLIQNRLMELSGELENKLILPLRIIEPDGHTGFIVELPWNRLFEISLYITDDRGVLPTICELEND